MTKRKLTSDEKNLCNNAIKNLKKRDNLIGPKIKYYDYMLSEGLRVNYEEQYEKFLNIKKEINQELFRNNMTMIELQRQIQDGVEVIKQKKNLCSQCGQEVNENG